MLQNVRKSLACAFRVEPEALAEDPQVDRLLEKVARGIVDRGLAAPALVVLESSKPLSFLGSQLLVFLEPLLKIFVDVKEYDVLVRALEDRRRLEQLLCAIEVLEDERIGRKGEERHG